VIYTLHPEAALEHLEQIAYYEEKSAGLGARYHRSFQSAVAMVQEGPRRFPVYIRPDIRRVFLPGFPFRVMYREVDHVIQILAIAPHRKRPGYWTGRI
jgi:plasmid stabilization system protein ParE